MRTLGRNPWKNACRFFVTLSLLYVLYPCFIHAQSVMWEVQDTPVTCGILNDVDFVDNITGWAVGSNCAHNAVIINTVNGGQEWLLQAEPFLGTFYAIHMVSATLGYAVGQDWNTNIQIIYKTTNGGQEWKNQNVNYTYSRLLDVFMIDATHGWAVGRNQDLGRPLLMHTSNGTTWTGINYTENASLPKDGTLNAIFFTDINHGWAVGNYSRDGVPLILRTTDGGTTWNKINHPIAAGEFTDVSFTSEDNGFVVGSTANQGVILKTIDGGDNWQVKTINPASARGLPSEANKNSLFTAAESMQIEKDANSTLPPLGETRFSSIVMDGANGMTGKIGFAAATTMVSEMITRSDLYETYDGGDDWTVLQGCRQRQG